MGRITYPDAIAIFQLVYYTPALFASIFVCSRHGWLKASGWFFLLSFCLVRMAGSCAKLYTITHPENNGAWTAALICAVLGLSPLLMASLGIICRAFYSILRSPYNIFFGVVLQKVVHLPALAAIILCIIGATSTNNASDIQNQETIKAGIILFAVIWLLLAILTLGAWLAKRRTGEGEGTLVLAVSCALPFILVRLIYSLLSGFDKHSTVFGLAKTSDKAVTVSLVMSVLEEMVVVLIYLAVGLKLPSVPKGTADTPAGEIAYRAGRGDFSFGKLGILSLGSAAYSAMKPKPEPDSERHGFNGRPKNGGRRMY